MTGAKREFLLAAMGLAWVSAQPLAFAQESSLQKAAAAGDKESVARLLAEGANVNQKVPYPVLTPLHWAAAGGYREVVELLLARGALVDAASDDGTALHSAANGGHTEVAALLLAKGAKVNVKNRSTFSTPLHIAAVRGNKELVELLLAKGADVRATNVVGGTPLTSAASGGHREVVTLLLANGAAVNPTTFNWTPLHLAAEEGHTEVAELLLERGADINAKNVQLELPLDLAKTDKMKALLRNWHSRKRPTTIETIADVLALGIAVRITRQFTFCELRAALWGSYDIAVRVGGQATTDRQPRVFKVTEGRFSRSPDPGSRVKLAEVNREWGDILFASKEAAFARGVPFFISEAALKSPTELTYTVHSNPGVSVVGVFHATEERSENRSRFAVFFSPLLSEPQPQARTYRFQDPLNPKSKNRFMLVTGMSEDSRCLVSNTVDLNALLKASPPE